MKYWLPKNSRLIRPLQHLGFWVLAYFVLIELFAYEDSYSKVDYIYTGIFLFTLIIPVYINLWVLVPRFLSQKKGVVFALLTSGLIVCGSLFNYYLFKDFIDYVLPGYYFISYYALSEIIIFFIAFLMVTTLLKLSKEWFWLQENKRKLAQLEKEKTEAEMKMLKAHLDPHFLFNSLNVIYSLARKNHKNTSDAVIQLSDIMRFITYDARESRIDLKEEVILIEKYIALQNYRLEKESVVQFEKHINNELDIAPLLFLPLVENAYKHGLKGNIQDGWIHINLFVKGNEVRFDVSNNVAATKNTETPDQGSGLENIRKRLELIYPNNHTFEIKRENDVFEAKINITA